MSRRLESIALKGPFFVCFLVRYFSRAPKSSEISRENLNEHGPYVRIYLILDSRCSEIIVQHQVMLTRYLGRQVDLIWQMEETAKKSKKTQCTKLLLAIHSG